MATSARLEELQQKFNENPRRYFAPLANEHRKLGDLEQAIALCRTHLPQQPQHVSGHIVLAQALFEAGNTPDARQTFEIALDLDPENLIALRFLGDIARQQGDHLTARQWYERVLDADPRNDEIARLVREIENGAASQAPQETQPAQAAADTPAAVAEPVATPESLAVTAETPAFEPNEELVTPDAPVVESSMEDLATAWQHEVAALDATTEAPTTPWREETPAGVDAVAHAPEVIEEVEVAAAEPTVDIGALAYEPEAPAQDDTVVAETAASTSQPNEPWSAPAEEPVEGAAPVGGAPDAPALFSEIDYSMFEAVADEEVSPQARLEVTLPPESEAPAVEAAHAPGDDWFAAPGGREPESVTAEGSGEASFDLDAAFQSVLPNKEDSPAESFAPAGPLSDFQDLPPSREWEEPASEALAAEAPALSAESETPDSVDDAFAALDQMAGSLAADASGSTMLLPDEEYTAEEPVEELRHVDALIGRTPESGIAAVEPTPVAFVTETMAELYLQQGFHAEALAVYKQLLDMNPADEVLAARVRSLEGGEQAPEQMGENVFAAAPSVDAYRPTPAAHADAVGQSMRAFLGVFARRRAPMRRRGRVNAAPVAQQQPETGLSALFGGTGGSDDGAAAVLAGAFAQPNAESETLPGRPTRAAAAELSLGDVFGAGVASGAGAASFDEFFSTGSADQSVRSPLDEEGSDMEQFTAWLEGLKKK